MFEDIATSMGPEVVTLQASRGYSKRILAFIAESAGWLRTSGDPAEV